MLNQTAIFAGETGPVIPYLAQGAQSGLYVLLLIILIPVAIASFFFLRFLYRNTVAKKMKTTLLQDYKKEADSLERTGKYVSAADIFGSKLKDPEKAAALYEMGGDYRKAAEIYDLLGEAAKAREMYERDGNLIDAAEISIREGEYEVAAKFYDRAGKKADAAQMLERAGQNMAAVRIYREAGDYLNASRLLEREGMTKEAAEMFGLSLRDKRPELSTLEDFYFYASRLEKSGQTDKALEIYREIDQADPAYKDVRERLHILTRPAEEEETPDGKTTIRILIQNASMDPKNSLKLWLHVLRNLQDAYAKGRSFGLISPENIAVDDQNIVSFLGIRPSAAYTSPETTKGIAPDATSDIYAMGVILYEMLTGSLIGLGTTRVADHVHDMPEWLDELVVRCIRKVREDRYQSIEAIFADIKELSRARKKF